MPDLIITPNMESESDKMRKPALSCKRIDHPVDMHNLIIACTVFWFFLNLQICIQTLLSGQYIYKFRLYA